MASRRGGKGGKGGKGGRGGPSSSSGGWAGGGWGQGSWESWGSGGSGGWGSGGEWWSPWPAGAEAGFDRPTGKGGSDCPSGPPWPDTRRPEERRGRGEAAIGSALGWLKEDAQEELDPSQIYSFLVAADLREVPKERWEDMRAQLLRSHGCTMTWRKNRHSRNEQAVPYRVTVRGLEAELAAEVCLDTLCSGFPDVVEPGDIEALPAPEANVQELVSGWLRSFTTRGAREVAVVNLEDAEARRGRQKVDRRRVPTTLRCKEKGRLAARRIFREAGLDRPAREAGPDRPQAADVPMEDAGGPAAEGLAEEASGQAAEGPAEEATGQAAEGPAEEPAAGADVEMVPVPVAVVSEPEQERAPDRADKPTEEAEEEPEADWERSSPSPEAGLTAPQESTLLAWQQGTLLPRAREVVSTWGWYFREVLGRVDKDWPGEAGLTAPHAGLTAPQAGLTAPRNMITAEGFHGTLFSVALCVTTFKRNHQIMQALPVNLCVTLPHRDTFFWAVVDFNEDNALEEHIMQEYTEALRTQHLRYFRSVPRWRTFHCPTAKNTAHVAAARVAPDDNWLYCVNLDNDNIVTTQWLEDVRRAASAQLPAARREELHQWPLEQPAPTLFSHWHNNSPGTYGRMGLPYAVFSMLGGYDQTFKAMGYQDVDLKRRASYAAQVDEVQAPWVGFSLPNDPENCALMESKKTRSLRNEQEKVYKAKYSGCAETWQEQTGSNRKVSQKRKKQVQVNRGVAPLGVQVEEAIPCTRREAGLTAQRPEAGLTAQKPPMRGSVTATTTPASSSAGPAASARADTAPAIPAPAARVPEARVPAAAPPPRAPPLLAASSKARVPAPVLQAAPIEAGRRLQEAGHDRPPEAGSDRPRERPHRPHFIVPFGTRTRAQTRTFRNSVAERVRHEMWPRRGEQRRGVRYLDKELGEEAVRLALLRTGEVDETEVVHVCLIDCTVLHWADARLAHIGSHHWISRRFMDQTHTVQMVADQCVRAERMWKPASVRVLAFYCNAGEHRSVSMAELYARATGFAPELNVIHMGRELWSYRSCGGCAECDPCVEHGDRRVAIGIFSRVLQGRRGA